MVAPGPLKHDDFALAARDHMRENGLARVHDAEQIGLNGVDPRLRRLIYEMVRWGQE